MVAVEQIRRNQKDFFQVPIPVGWQKYVDEARGDMPQDEWVQMVIRDALIDAGKWPGGKLKEEEKPPLLPS